jgi:hypothetical protein
MAGESAREAARRMRAKAERLQRSAERWEQGADGEAATAAVLDALPAGWFAYHDLRWPGRRLANIDHVVIGPPGVFVIDSKAWTGRVEVREDVLRHNGRARQSAVVGAADAALALAEHLSRVDATRVHPVLCFVRDEELTGWARDVMVCSTGNLREMLLSRPRSFVPMRADDVAAEVRMVGRRLTGRTPGRRPVQEPVEPRAPRAPRARRRSGVVGIIASLAVAAAVVLSHQQIGDALGRLLTPSTVADEVGPCAEMRAEYPHGVGRKGARDAVEAGERAVTGYAVKPKVYRQNRALDTDGDGIVCER